MIWHQIDGSREMIAGEGTGGVLIQGDIRTVDLSAYNGRVQCVYMDPPFFTGDDFYFRMRIGEKGWQDGTPAITLRAYSDSRTGGQVRYLWTAA